MLLGKRISGDAVSFALGRLLPFIDAVRLHRQAAAAGNGNTA